MFGIRVGLYDVFADNPHGLEVAGQCGLVHLRDFQADLVAYVRAVKLLIEQVVGRVIDLQVAGALMRLAPHVGGSLHIILAAQWIHSYAGASDIAGHHGQVGDGHDRFGAMAVFGDAQPVESHGVFRRGVLDGGRLHFFTRHAVDAFESIEI